MSQYPPIRPGTHVRTTTPNESLRDEWLPSVQAVRKWGVEGVVGMHHDSHGLCYEVAHADGSEGTYDPSEFEVLVTFRNTTIIGNFTGCPYCLKESLSPRKETWPQRICKNPECKPGKTLADPRMSVGVAIPRKGDLIYYGKRASGKYAFSGGFVEVNETARQGALRELPEETGCTVEEWSSVELVYEGLATAGHSRLFFYVLRSDTQEIIFDPAKVTTPGEFFEGRWGSIHELPPFEEWEFSTHYEAGTSLAQ